MHYHSCRVRNMPCSPYFSILLRQISGRLKAVDLGCTRDVLGKERKEALHSCIFGDRNLVSPNSKTLINRLYNMITLSPDLHARWGLGYLILEPLTAESTTLELKIRFQWTPNHQATDCITIETPPSSLETPPKPKLLMNEDTGELIHDGHIVTLRTVDPIKRHSQAWSY